MREGYLGEVRYLLADHLGSSSVVTDGAGAVVGTMKYYAYGGERAATGQMVTDKLFTGQQREPEAASALGLFHSCPEQRRRDGARFYSTTMGRFLSADPFVSDVSDVVETLGPALMVTQPSGFPGLGGRSVHGPVVGLARGGQSLGLYAYIPSDEDESPPWPAEGFMPRQDLLGLDDLNADNAPGGPGEPSCRQ